MSTQTDTHDSGESSDAAVTIRTAELVVGVLLAAFGSLVVWSNYQLGAGWADDGPEAGYFPLRMGLFILLGSIAVIVQAVLKNDRSPFVERAQLRLVAIVLVPLVIYIAVLKVLGIYVASALFIGLFMMAVGKFSWWKSLIVGGGTMLVLFWVFEVQFKVPLPKGPLESLLGY
ncbi:MAG: putative tricarboxylic transport rane protein [Burkholderiales bacterium]|jgi:putative tricarboxylic transport membrane protein|nr:tctB3 [Burkholderia sp.]